MELVHKLNPDGVEAEPKIYRHPIPDDKFEELKKGCPEANLTEKPNIYFQYYPLDWLSGDENIQGVAIKLSFDSFFGALVPQAVNMSMGNKTLTQFYICLTGYYVERKYAFVTVSLQELLNISEDEIKIWGSLLTTWDNVYIRQIYDGNFTIITYNGILADTTDLLGSSPKIFFLLLLLNKVYLPEVDVAREQIISFSLENAFNLSKIQKELDISDYNSHFILNKELLVTENKLFELLRDNPNLENEIWKDIDNEHTISEYQEKLKSETTIRISFDRNYSLRTCILLSSNL